MAVTLAGDGGACGGSRRRARLRGMTIELPARAALLVEGILHPRERNQFVSGCVPTTTEELVTLCRGIDDHLAYVTSASRQAAAIDVEMATAIASSLRRALADSTTLGAEHRALLRGAADYFMRREDSAHDLSDALGFDDDARVLNRVLESLGRGELAVRLG